MTVWFFGYTTIKEITIVKFDNTLLSISLYALVMKLH